MIYSPVRRLLGLSPSPLSLSFLSLASFFFSSLPRLSLPFSFLSPNDVPLLLTLFEAALGKGQRKPGHVVEIALVVVWTPV